MTQIADKEIIGLYATPAERIIKTLIHIKEQYINQNGNDELLREVNFAINNIAERKIY